MSQEKILDPVAQPSDEVLAMQEDWALVDALAGGTKAMRRAGEAYLPKRPIEEEADYKHRLATATLYPAFGETVETYTGRVFSEPLKVSEEVPQWIRDEVLADVDRQGNNFENYANHWFARAMEKGLGYTLVDAPNKEAGSEEERKALGLRPYLVFIPVTAVLGWQTDGDGKLTQVRIMFCERKQNLETFKMEVEELIRVYQLDVTRTFVKQTSGDMKGRYVEDTTRQVANSIGVIPLVPAYTARTGFMTARPPLRELAYLNVKHWQQQSSHDSLLETASVPILALSGVDSNDKIVIGAKHAVKLPAEAKMEYVEHTGAALGASEKSMAELKEEMRQAGAKLLIQSGGPSNKTATESREDSSRENSKLGGIVRQFEGSLDKVLELLALYRAAGDKAKPVADACKLSPNLDPDTNPHETIKTLTGLRNASCLSDQTLFEETQARGMLSKERTWEDEQQRILENAPPPVPPGMETDDPDSDDPEAKGQKDDVPPGKKAKPPKGKKAKPPKGKKPPQE